MCSLDFCVTEGHTLTWWRCEVAKLIELFGKITQGEVMGMCSLNCSLWSSGWREWIRVCVMNCWCSEVLRVATDLLPPFPWAHQSHPHMTPGMQNLEHKCHPRVSPHSSPPLPYHLYNQSLPGQVGHYFLIAPTFLLLPPCQERHF